MALATVYRLLNEFEDACIRLAEYAPNRSDKHAVWYNSEHEAQLRRRYHAAKRKLRAAVKELLPKHSLVPRAVEDML